MPHFTVFSVQDSEVTTLDLQIVESASAVVKVEQVKKEKKERVCQPDKWKKNLRKHKKNLGLEYLRANGTVGAEKLMGPPCTCKLRCFKRLGDENCSKVFSNFWKLGDYSVQNAYIAGCVRITLPKVFSKKNTSEPGRRNYSRCFYVNVGGVDTEICKQAFLNLHSISNGRLDRLLKKKQKIGNTGIDARGRHATKINRVSNEKIDQVRQSIDDFRRFAGYHDTATPDVLEMIPAPYNVRTMYRNYCQELLSEGKAPLTEFRYRKILQTDYNLDFAERYQSKNQENFKSVESHATQTTPVREKNVYTTLDSDGNTYVVFSPDAFGNCSLPTQGWTFATTE